MASFFRRSKPETPSSKRRYSVEELAAAFPDPRPAPAGPVDPAEAIEER